MSFSALLDLRSYQTESARHSHDYAQLVLPVRGALEIEIGHYAGLVQANNAAFIPRGEHHCFSGKGSNLFVVVDIKVPPLNLEQSFPNPFYTLSSSCEKLIGFIEDFLLRGPIDYTSQELIYNLLINTLSHSPAAVPDAAVLKAKQWMDKHFAEPINIAYLAKHCYLSISQLQRRFSKMIGCSLAEYWRNCRLEHAKKLLATTTLSIVTIAYTVGYEHLSAFSRAFSQQYQLSPSQWREMTLNVNTMHLSDK